jgi:hypothetical protein
MVRGSNVITRGNEPTLFDACQRKQAIEVYTSDFKAEQQLQDTQTFDLSAKRSRRQRKRDLRQIVVTEEWALGLPFGGAGHSFVDELMTLTTKEPVPEEKALHLAGKYEYDVRSAAWDKRKPGPPVEIPIPDRHEAYAIEWPREPMMFKL